MDIVGYIIEKLLSAQEEDRVQKYVKKHGKPYVAKYAIQSSVQTMFSKWDYGDHHIEKDWYDYEDESMEPKPPKECMLGL